MARSRWVVSRGPIDIALLLVLLVGCSAIPGAPTDRRTPVPPPTPTPLVTPTPTINDSVGSVSVTFRGTTGSDHVDCHAIEDEFAVLAPYGRIRWSAIAGSRRENQAPYVSGRLPMVTVDPSSGVLDSGQAIVHVRGTFAGGPGDSFFIGISAPNQSGYTGATLELFC